MAVRSLAQSSLVEPFSTNSMLAGYSGNAFHHLETVRLSSAASTVEFTNLARYSDFQHLQIRAVARTSRADTGDTIRVQFNQDSSSNYRSHLLAGAGSSVFSFAQNQSTSFEIYRISGGNDAGSAFGVVVCDILDPFDNAKNTTTRAFGGSSASYREVCLNSGLYLSTSALTHISLSGGNGSFVSGSRFSLYGIKARA